MDNRGLPPQTSNFYCLPGRAGGTPMGISLSLYLALINNGRSVILHHVTSYFLATVLDRQYIIT